VADRLDVVAVRVEDVCTVVVGVIERTHSGRSVVCPASFERGDMEGIDGLAIVDREGDVEPPYDRPPSRLDPEERLAVPAETGGLSPTGSSSTVSPSGARALS